MDCAEGQGIGVLGIGSRDLTTDLLGLGDRCRRVVRLEEPSLSGQVEEFLQFLSRERRAESLREGRTEVGGGPCAIEPGQQEVLLLPERERIARTAVPD